MQVLIQKLFGSASVQSKPTKTATEWKRTLAAILDDLWTYILTNVETDEMHMMMLYTGIASAKDALKQKDFWPQFTEGVLRIAFLLLGDIPEHRAYTRGNKRNGHYRLDRHRSVHYLRNGQQALNTLLAARRFGHPELTIDPQEAYRRFRRANGYKSTYKDFFTWFRKTFPADYAAVFSAVQSPGKLRPGKAE